jgi:hypothetical protein
MAAVPAATAVPPAAVPPATMAATMTATMRRGGAYTDDQRQGDDPKTFCQFRHR